MADDPVDTANALSTSVDDVSTRTRGMTSSSNAFARAITSAFAQGATGAKSFDSVLKSLALRLSSLSLNLALKPVTGALTSGLPNLFNGWAAPAGNNAANEGPVQPFAKGGVIAAP